VCSIVSTDNSRPRMQWIILIVLTLLI